MSVFFYFRLWEKTKGYVRENEIAEETLKSCLVSKSVVLSCCILLNEQVNQQKRCFAVSKATRPQSAVSAGQGKPCPVLTSGF